MLWFGWQVGRLRIQIFGFAMVGTLFMVSAIWYHPLTTRGGLGAIKPNSWPVTFSKELLFLHTLTWFSLNTQDSAEIV